MVYCPKGAALDFFVDIRVGSPTYGQSVSVELNEKNCKMLFLPVGIAHGFVSLLDNSLMVYKIDCSYDPKTDSGIRFDSCNVQLPIRNECLIVSSRDSSLVEWKDFESGFMYE